MANYFRYSVHDCDEFNDCYSFQSVFDEDDTEWLAQEAAEDWHNFHDGWESNWDNGVTFWLWTEAGKLVGSFSITREYEPRFSATQATRPTQEADK